MNKILIMLMIFLLSGCATNKLSINEFNNPVTIPVAIKSMVLTGPSLSDLDREIIESNIRFDLSKRGLINQDMTEDAINISIRVDSRQIGYNIFLMTEIHNFYMEISAYDIDNKPISSIISNSKIYYSPRDMNRLDLILTYSINSFYYSLIKKIKSNKQ